MSMQKCMELAKALSYRIWRTQAVCMSQQHQELPTGRHTQFPTSGCCRPRHGPRRYSASQPTSRLLGHRLLQQNDIVASMLNYAGNVKHTYAGDSSILSVDAVVGEKQGAVLDAGLSSKTLHVVQVDRSSALAKGGTQMGHSSCNAS